MTPRVDPVSMMLAAQFLVMVVPPFLATVWALGNVWAISHCLRFFPETPNKSRWLAAILAAPIAGATAYALVGRPASTRRSFF